jgi:hypothetical protein
MFSLVKKVDADAFDVFKPFLYKRLQLPVKFHSVLEMIGLGKFYYVIIEGCLVAFRVSSMYGNYSCIVYFSPISLSNDVDVEQGVFISLLRAGFSVRLTAGEIKRLNINTSLLKVKRDAYYNEFIYSTRAVLEMPGSAYAYLRNKVRRFDKDGSVKYGFSSEVMEFVLSWAKKKKLRYNAFMSFLSKTDRDDIHFTRLYVNGLLSGFTAVEHAGEFYHSDVIVVDHDCEFDLVPALHYYTVDGLPDKDTLLNTGSGVNPGLCFQKRRLRPMVEELVYRVPAMGSIANAYSLVKAYL